MPLRFESHENFAELVDYAYWCSCIGKGLRLQLARRLVLAALSSSRSLVVGPSERFVKSGPLEYQIVT